MTRQQQVTIILSCVLAVCFTLFNSNAAAGPYTGGTTKFEKLSESMRGVVSADDVADEYRIKTLFVLKKYYEEACLHDLAATTAALKAVSDEVDAAVAEAGRIKPQLAKERSILTTLTSEQTANLAKIEALKSRIVDLNAQVPPLETSLAAESENLAALGNKLKPLLDQRDKLDAEMKSHKETFARAEALEKKLGEKLQALQAPPPEKPEPKAKEKKSKKGGKEPEPAQQAQEQTQPQTAPAPAPAPAPTEAEIAKQKQIEEKKKAEEEKRQQEEAKRQAEIEKVKQDLAGATALKSEAASSLKEAAAQRDQLQPGISELEGKVNTSKSEIAGLGLQIKRINDRVTISKVEISWREKRDDTLTGMIANSENIIADLETRLDSAQHIIGTISPRALKEYKTVLAPYLTYSCPPGMRMIEASYCIDTYEFPDKKGQMPEANITWDQAVQQCSAAGKRLCTGAEWELACAGPNCYLRGVPDDYSAETCNLGMGRYADVAAKPSGWRPEGTGEEEPLPVVEPKPGAKSKTGKSSANGKKAATDEPDAPQPPAPGDGNTPITAHAAASAGATPIAAPPPIVLPDTPTPYACDSPYGVADMIGNLQEWTSDSYKSNSIRIIHIGGHVSQMEPACEATNWYNTSTTLPELGFRCCVTLGK